MGIDEDFDYFILVDWGNRVRCCYHFWTLISKAFLVYNYFILDWALKTLHYSVMYELGAPEISLTVHWYIKVRK